MSDTGKLSDIDDRALVDVRVLEAFGVSHDELMGMGVLDVWALAESKGYRMTVEALPLGDNDRGHLSVTMSDEPRKDEA